MKNKYVFTFIITCLFITTAALKSFSQVVKADFSGITQFWHIQQKLAQEQLPDSTEWKKLFDAPFYAFYTKWGQEKYMKRMIITAFTPSKQHARDSLIKLNKWEKEVLLHLLKARSERSRLDAFVNSLKQKDLFAEAKEKASIYLPKTALQQDIRPVIGFGLFHPQSNANDSCIVIDLLSVHDSSIIEILGHEIHHFYTYSFRKKLTATETEDAFPLLEMIFSLQLEGIADLLNAEWFLSNPGNSNDFLYKTYSEHFFDPSKNLNQIDTLLAAIADTPSLMKKNALLIKDLLPLGAHPHGYYMAKTIATHAGTQPLIDALINPFDFLRLYNETAKKIKGAFLFSKKSMKILNTLEKQYIE